MHADRLPLTPDEHPPVATSLLPQIVELIVTPLTDAAWTASDVRMPAARGLPAERHDAMMDLPVEALAALWPITGPPTL